MTDRYDRTWPDRKPFFTQLPASRLMPRGQLPFVDTMAEQEEAIRDYEAAKKRRLEERAAVLAIRAQEPLGHRIVPWACVAAFIVMALILGAEAGWIPGVGK